MAFRGGSIADVDDHGGNLMAAQSRFPHAPTPWLDLSTGINPHSYPLFDLPSTALTRLPEPARLAELREVAAIAYGAPSASHVVPAPGTQILLPRIAGLLQPGRARVLSPTYAEHGRAAAIAGHRVEGVGRFEDLAEADLAIVVNPNNPDGRIVGRERLLELADIMRRKGGILIVDEAFMDIGPREESIAGDVGAGGIVVLRSFGKFFGLAGIRLGFALASQEIARELAAQLGPWAVAGPALEYGLRALADDAWKDAMRERLALEASRLDGLLAANGLGVVGGTSLFRFIRDRHSESLFGWLASSGTLVRRFREQPDRIRVGLPGDETAFRRLGAALESWRLAHPGGE